MEDGPTVLGKSAPRRGSAYIHGEKETNRTRPLVNEHCMLWSMTPGLWAGYLVRGITQSCSSTCSDPLELRALQGLL